MKRRLWKVESALRASFLPYSYYSSRQLLPHWHILAFPGFFSHNSREKGQEAIPPTPDAVSYFLHPNPRPLSCIIVDFDFFDSFFFSICFPTHPRSDRLALHAAMSLS